MFTSIAKGKSIGGLNASNTLTIQNASNTPATPPKSDSNTLSVGNWRIKRTRLAPSEVLIVGDRPAREIRAGKELGMHTVRLRHGEFKSQVPTGPEEEPDYVIGNISQVSKLPFAWG